MGNRIIKESINRSRGITGCSFFAQDLYKRIITYADDYGRFDADPQIMLTSLYPREISDLTVSDIMDGLLELAGAGKIAFYTAVSHAGDVYGRLPTWDKHQRLRETRGIFPFPTSDAINEWYLARYVPPAKKIEYVKKAGCKCGGCGRFVCASAQAARLVKMGAGLFRVEKIDPRGEAAEGNLRLLCPQCLENKGDSFCFDDLRQVAADCGKLPQTAADGGLNTNTNPNLESESEPEVGNTSSKKNTTTTRKRVGNPNPKGKTNPKGETEAAPAAKGKEKAKTTGSAQGRAEAGRGKGSQGQAALDDPVLPAGPVSSGEGEKADAGAEKVPWDAREPMPRGPFRQVMLSDVEMARLQGLHPTLAAGMLILLDYRLMIGRTFMDHYGTVERWCRQQWREGEEPDDHELGEIADAITAEGKEERDAGG